ncbi:MAG: acyl-CoA dehydrogenase [Gammaproteobacteria bacterium]|nr:acyl-CoA dehydrogenase [Gammaproteobacteria bacterium]MDH5345028.1 acyl-CoA dehydrogenase [Gammaproteobacteria bacterium]
MSDYIPPLKDIRFAMHELAGLGQVLALDAYADVDADTIDQVIEEAGNFARDVLAPLNVSGDRQGCHVEDRAVRVAEGFADAYQQFVDSGWQSLPASPVYGGMGLPEVAAVAASEMWHSANLSFSLCPLLTSGAITAIEAHGSEALKETYLPKLVSGEWSGTMVLTEPQAGSDLAAITTKAVPEGDHYRVTGTKIFITWGDHPMAANTIHLVLARVEGAPEGVRGISMFLVPKFLVNEDGSLGERNDVYPVSVEHKLGIHASPTCVMNFGDAGGAVGYLVGEENRGLANMFTMMNHARIEVGIQGVAISERAYQLARKFALERVQGTAHGVVGRATIIHHPDVRRMLLLMKSQVEAMRAAVSSAGALFDLDSHCADDSERAAASARLALLTPIVKGWLTEVAQEVTSLGVQVHGGMGFVEESGAAQHMRDARILPIYEGTTGIQANDLAGRKILGDEGRAIRSLIGDMRATSELIGSATTLADIKPGLDEAIDALEIAVDWLVAAAPYDPTAPGAASVNLLMLAGTVLGGWHMARAALAVTANEGGYDKAFCDAKLETARFYVAHVLPRSHAYCRAATAGSERVMTLPADGF